MILVRDQASKKKIPNYLSHALCLTIYEAKGLEFEDVVLFNFFSDSGIEENCWNLLSLVEAQKEVVSAESLAKEVTVHKKKPL